MYTIRRHFNKCQAIKLKIWQNVNDTSTSTTKKEELKSAERERHTVTSPKNFWSKWYSESNAYSIWQSFPALRGGATSSLSHFLELYGAASVAPIWFSIVLSLLLSRQNILNPTPIRFGSLISTQKIISGENILDSIWQSFLVLIFHLLSMRKIIIILHWNEMIILRTKIYILQFYLKEFGQNLLTGTK